MYMDVALYGAEQPCRTSINKHLKLNILAHMKPMHFFVKLAIHFHSLPSSTMYPLAQANLKSFSSEKKRQPQPDKIALLTLENLQCAISKHILVTPIPAYFLTAPRIKDKHFFG
jgi:hypothetical protein